jgi:hypothetical protein
MPDVIGSSAIQEKLDLIFIILIVSDARVVTEKVLYFFIGVLKRFNFKLACER